MGISFFDNKTTTAGGDVKISRSGELNQYVHFKKGTDEPLVDPQADQSEDDANYVKQLCMDVTRAVRALLPEGTLNNVLRRGKKASRKAAMANFGYITQKRPGQLNAIIEKMHEKLSADAIVATNASATLKTVIKEAAISTAARHVGGGVCAHIAHVTMGVLTTKAVDLYAQILWHKADHQFVVVRRQTTRWYVIDPWVGNSYVCPLAKCYFAIDRIGARWPAIIKGPLICPYGISFSDEDVLAAYRSAEASAGLLPEVEHVWLHENNLRQNTDRSDCTLAAGPDQWGSKA